MTTANPSHHYQQDIQGLRAVAVLLVVIYHSGLPGFPGGYVGVDVFFVISGYLITGLLFRELDRDNTISLSRFYARRFRRLLPAASLVLLATIFTAWFAYSPLALKQFSSSAFATAAYLSNAWFAHLATDYLAEDTAANPLLHTWSLSVEEQFYLVWPLLLLLVFRFSTKPKLRKYLTIFFCVSILILLWSTIWLTQYNQPWAFFGSPTRAWEFAVGSLVALWVSQGHRLERSAAMLIGGVGLALILIAAISYTRATPFPGWAALVPVVGTALVISAAHTKQMCGISVFLAIRPMQFIGDISYSVYLWHWPVFVFWAQWSGDLVLAEKLLSIVLIFVLAWLTLILVENPIRFNRRISSKTAQSLILGAVLSSLTAGVALTVRVIAANNLESPQQKIFLAAKADIPQIADNGCHLDYFATEPKNCVYGDLESEFTVILFGDSHAEHWFPAIESVAKSEAWKLIPLTKSGCPSALYQPFNKKIGRAYTECSLWQQRALETIRKVRPHLTLVANYNSYLPNDKVNLSKWKRAIDDMLTSLSESSRQVVILKDTPPATENTPECLSRSVWLEKDSEQYCRVFTHSPKADKVFALERKAAEVFNNVATTDLTNSICNAASCSVYRDGVVLFSDRDHLTKAFSSSLAPSLKQALTRILDNIASQ